MLTKTETKAVVKAFTTMLMTTSFHELRLRAVAEEAKVPLAKLLMSHATRLDLFAAFARQIDETVLLQDDADMAEEPARERLFDVFMRRFDALLPYKLALVQLERDARRDPALTMALARVASASMARMAAGADLDVDGARGAVVVAGLLQVYARVMRVFVREADESQALTMAELDKALRQAEQRIGDLDGVMRLLRGEGGLSGTLEKLRMRMGDLGNRGSRGDGDSDTDGAQASQASQAA